MLHGFARIGDVPWLLSSLGPSSLGHFDEATAEFAATLRLNPHPYIWQSGSHAEALSATGHYEQAIAEIEAAVAAQPKSPLGLLYRGRVECGPGITPRLPDGSSRRASSILLRRRMPSFSLRSMTSWDASK